MVYGYSAIGSSFYGAIAPYGTLNLTRSSPAQSWTEPVTLAEAKAFLSLPLRSPADDAEDALLQQFIAAARVQAELAQGRDIVPKQWDLSLDYFFDYAVELRAPLISVELVRYTDSNGAVTTLTENVDYIVDANKQPGRILPAYNKFWPVFTARPSSAVLVRFNSGFDLSDPFWLDDGQAVKNGMSYLISSWFNNRLPFEMGTGVMHEYPYTVQQALSAGALFRVR